MITRADKKQKSVLITGGGGLIGRHLTSALLEEGYNVSHLSRKQGSFGKVRVYRWASEQKIIDPAFTGEADIIVHLAGANIGGRRWSSQRKEEIIRSRSSSALFLFEKIKELGVHPEAFISASATGYYGAVTSEKIFEEEDSCGEDFLGKTCFEWEKGAGLFREEGIRTVIVRIAPVLSAREGILDKFIGPARFGIFPIPGNGKQFFPWIHISDLCGIFIRAIKDNTLQGAYNAASPESVTCREFLRALSEAVKKPFIGIPVPSFAMKIALGEMSDMVLKGSRISSEKIRRAGFDFKFPALKPALNNIFNPEKAD